MGDGILDEAYGRLHRTGPEFQGWLSNHGPMTVEALVRHGHAIRVHSWLDSYLGQLDDLPRGLQPIGTDWRPALGDPKRAGDWLDFFDRALAERPWRDVLGVWWPRLLPGIAAGATHGVIRVGHAVRALRDTVTPERVTELAQSLGYWAARWQSVPGADAALTRTGPVRTTGGVTEALARIPRIADRSGGIRQRFPQLLDVPGWDRVMTAVPPPRTPAEAAAGIVEMIHRASLDYLRFGHAEPVMLVHAVTAPTAVLRTLPALDPALWAPSMTAAWTATAALTALYAPPEPAGPPLVAAGPPAETFARAARHGDAHVVKLADAVLDVYAATDDGRVLAAAGYAAQLI